MSEANFLFAGTSYAPTLLAGAHALAAAVIIAIGAAVLIRGRASLASVLFFAITATSSAWLVSSALMHAARTESVALVWAQMANFTAMLISPAVFQFTSEFAGKRRRLRGVSFLFWFLAGVIGLIGTVAPFALTDLHQYSWGFYPQNNLWHGVRSSLHAVITGSGIYLLWWTYRTSEAPARDRAASVLLAFVVASFGFLDMLPSMGIASIPVAYLAVVALVSVLGHGVWRYHLVDVTPEYASSQILETMKSAVVVVDMAGQMRVVNRAACNLLGFRRADLVNSHIRKILDPNVGLTTEQLVYSGGVLEHEMVWQAVDGARIDVTASSSFVRDTEGTPVAVVYVANDVTERRRAEQAIRESELRYRTLFDANPLPMWIYEPDTLAFIAVNQAAVQKYGYTREEFVTMKISDIRPEADVPALMEAVAKAEGFRGPHVFRHRTKKGRLIDVEITSLEFLSGGRRARLVIAQDVTDRKRSVDALRESEERYRELFENATDMVYTCDLDGRLLSMNRSGERILGYPRVDVLVKRLEDLAAPESRDRVRQALVRHVRDGIDSTFFDLELQARDGRRVPVEISSRLIIHDGKPVGIQAIGRDMTERKANEARFRLLFERNLAGVYRSTVDGLILDCNDACARIFGFASREEFISRSAESLYVDDEDRRRLISMLRSQKSITNVELRLRRKDGAPIWVLENVSLLVGEQGQPDIMEGTIIDITERKTAHEEMEYQAYHDALTGLPNRLLFRDRITVALAHSRRTARAAGIMFLDLDQFKQINDTLGHTIGDRLLQDVGARLVDCVRAEDTVARMGGDEFTILLSDVGDRRGASIAAQKVLARVNEPVVVEGHELTVSTSIGIAIFPDDGHDAETLLRSADRAMYQAKESGRNNFKFATASEAEADGRLLVEHDLRHALERNELLLYYQPIAEMATQRVVGVEALLRWNHPQNGLLLPKQFLAVAEASHLIVPIGDWVLSTACRQMKQWHEAGFGGLRLAVNCSAREFQQRDLVHVIERALQGSGLRPEFLDLEFAEAAAMQNAEQSLAIMRNLRQLGVRMSIDDFGTGYSSLPYLRRFPVDTVKIDQNLIHDLTADSSEESIISAVISMAHALGLHVVAEGIETVAQFDLLRAESCDEMQGHYFSPPIPADDLETLLRERVSMSH